jgi:hypothetical protein
MGEMQRPAVEDAIRRRRDLLRIPEAVGHHDGPLLPFDALLAVALTREGVTDASVRWRAADDAALAFIIAREALADTANEPEGERLARPQVHRVQCVEALLLQEVDALAFR